MIENKLLSKLRSILPIESDNLEEIYLLEQNVKMVEAVSLGDFEDRKNN